MSEYTGLSIHRELARMRHAELVQEAADMRANRKPGSTTTKLFWLAVSLIGLALVATAAWVLIIG